jgi:hypothetical protein
MQQLDNALAGLNDGTFGHVCEVSRATGITRSTIGQHLHGGLSKREAQQSRQQLSSNEELALAKWVQRLSSTGHPVLHSFLCKLAEEICRLHMVDSSKILTKIGKNWVSRFLGRNPILQSKVTKNIEASRKEVTEAQLDNWFREFK